MKASELAKFIEYQIGVHGDFEIVCNGDHQMLYKVRGVDLAYVEDISQHMLEEIHKDDVPAHIEDGGNPIKVLVVYP